MINQVKITFWWLILLVFIFNGKLSQSAQVYNEVKHEISIRHPGEKYAVPTTLTEVQNDEGLPIQYHMDVKSVICLAEVCKVIPVRLYWNNIGEYQKYKLQEGATLEKYEADLFEPNDYEKLQSILENQNSPFRDVYLEDIWTVPSTQMEDVDAISGATILELDDKDTVPGAALTCYTLWHWANGNIVSAIRKTTSESVSNAQLKDFILNENATYFKLALSALDQRNMYDEQFVNAVVTRVLNKDALLKEAFAYMEKASVKHYLDASSELFFKGEEEQRLAAISSLKNSNIDIPKPYLDGFSNQFSELESFQEVSALLELMQKKNPNSSTVNNNVFALLDSYFITARRTYWFLTNQELTSAQEKKLQAFQKKNKERL